MAKGQATFAKRQKEIARLKHRDDKAARKAERKANPGSSDLKDMMAYVDEFGRITNKTPEQQASVAYILNSYCSVHNGPLTLPSNTPGRLGWISSNVQLIQIYW